ncbi:hypothetical protein BO78DRAFT_443280 [Aspergillus sclerotiicarbonarius CBS 121057]|uniref:Uncharacterized protein n=1 Tax=Aspergillus sclerotiicarbonarius (strain CBS 121057 / IBT 28362) TaxID=1448318 RepID=A0A319EI67_ASPSB|nr:hypothetical protein BO78DRAFT_443280 [Aspergillus sclerotiicarbonarius CBS 121057]
MEAHYHDDELEQLLQSIDDLPPPDPNYGLGLDPALLTIDSLRSNSFSYFPPLPPPLGEGTSGAPKMVTPTQPIRQEPRTLELENHVASLEKEIESLKSTVKQLKAYLSHLQPWMTEVAEALDKLGEAPVTPQLGFRPDGDL